MKRKQTTLIILTMMLMATSPAMASSCHDPQKKHEHDHDHHQQSTKKLEKIKNAYHQQDITTEVNNKICPVSGDPIDAMGEEPFKFEYNGKTYNLCCKMCVRSFKKNPEKYIAIVEEMKKEQPQEEAKEDQNEQHDDHQGHMH